MNIREEILSYLKDEFIKRKLEEEFVDMDEHIARIAVYALSQIREIIQKENLPDFDVVEEIVCILEKYNIDCGFRHDF